MKFISVLFQSGILTGTLWIGGFLFLASCLEAESKWEKISDIETPEGSSRISYPKESFSNFVRNLPLKSEPTLWTYQKENIIRRYDVLAVLNVPLLFRDDLEQCADFAMRIWAEYHKQKNLLNRFYLFDYNGRKKSFRESGMNYVSFLRKSFVSSNSYSLKKGGMSITEADLRPGDIFVQNETGGIGHASMVLDSAENSNGEKFYLIGFSFMPAQEMHIEKAPKKFGTKGWFTYKGFLKHLEEFYPYGEPVLRRFPEK
ncbi:DUF4846 domain-containing protein [Leptospira stimsonii]|uniref:Lipoprotein n=1 Tax=Leptospira stimsonii TaxID=2202203 RepID=A0ABY2NAU7_9LEPT|nr:hypothetical protein EHO98_19925 [Leptospira stimsonii]TGM20336.1 hypothetical protein EHQ90_03290 [Leptospira stimsonii]